MATDGSDEIRAQLTRIINFLENDLAVPATHWIQQSWKPAAQRRAPVLTGAFQGSIDGAASASGMTLFADVEYALVIEFGSSTHRAQPTLGPALMSEIVFLGDFIDAEIQRLL